MSRTRRYARNGASASDGPASVTPALDPVTGLPVRVYRFAAGPTLAPAQLVHPHVPRVLDSGVDDDGGYLVADHVTGVSDLRTQPGGLDDATAAAVFDAVAAAHHLGVSHGDLQARRVLRRGDDVWIEGFGVPWRDSADPADDVRALAAALLDLPGHALSAAVVDVLRHASQADAPTAAEVARALDDLEAAPAPAREPTPSPGATIATAASPAAEATRPPAPPAIETAAPPPETTAPPAPEATPAPPEAAATPPAPVAASAGEAREPTTPTVRFSKTPPPGVSYRSGETPLDERRADPEPARAVQVARRQRRRQWMVVALIVGALALAVVTALSQRPVPPPAQQGGPVTAIVVDVRLEPASLPPASLVIVSSPPASRLSPGTALGSVPRRVVFDAEGTWQVEARFQDRRSETATFTLPEERDVVLRFPSTP